MIFLCSFRTSGSLLYSCTLDILLTFPIPVGSYQFITVLKSLLGLLQSPHFCFVYLIWYTVSPRCLIVSRSFYDCFYFQCSTLVICVCRYFSVGVEQIGVVFCPCSFDFARDCHYPLPLCYKVSLFSFFDMNYLCSISIVSYLWHLLLGLDTGCSNMSSWISSLFVCYHSVLALVSGVLSFIHILNSLFLTFTAHIHTHMRVHLCRE